MLETHPLFAGASRQAVFLVVALYGSLILIGTMVALGLALALLRRPVNWHARISALRDRPWGWADALLLTGALALLVAGGMLLTVPLSDGPAWRLLIVQTCLVDGLGLLVLNMLLHARRLSWSQAFGLERSRIGRRLGMAVLFYLALLPILVFSAFVYEEVLSSRGYTPHLQDVALVVRDLRNPWLRTYFLLLAVVVAPCLEECVFRGVGLPVLARSLGLGPAILLTSLLFAVAHHHLPSLVPLGVISTAFALGYVYSGSLWVPIAMHALFNAVNLGILLTLLR